MEAKSPGKQPMNKRRRMSCVVRFEKLKEPPKC